MNHSYNAPLPSLPSTRLGPVMTIKVIGEVGPQGSKKYVGRGVMVESSKKVKPWREAVVWAAREVMAHRDGKGISGPVVAEIIFTVRKPKSAPKRRRTWPATRPDISKVLRSTEDALTTAGAWDDDSCVVEYSRLAKVYPGEDRDALDVPGAVIRIASVMEGV
jgi:Holliday junction resolvase RusA-like endonuclease